MHSSPNHAIKGYEIKEIIGEGGFGVVYRAYQPVVGRDVAIKVILPERADQPEFIRRFEFEAQMIAHLEHPHIVPMYDYWRDPSGAYLVMRWFPTSLRAELKRGHWTAEATARLLDQIASALAVAHRNGVVHRDIKPDNFLLDQDNNAYLADFGIAKSPDLISSMTQDGVVVGSPAYITPEQVNGDVVGPQTDVYSLGIVLYEMLTGERPFPSNLTPFEMMKKHLGEPLPSLLSIRPDLPAALDQIIQKATAKNPANRYAGTLNLAIAFRQAIAGYSSLPIPEGAASVPTHIETAPIEIELHNPYKGLRAFQETDAADFFGRETLTERLVQHLADGSRFLAVVGPSGSGKSSLVRAGLVPALRQNAVSGSSRWFIVDMVPGTHPWEELEAQLFQVSTSQQTGVLAQLTDGERGLARVIKRILPDEETNLFLLVDQFEELFTLVDDEVVRRHFLEAQ